VPKAGLMTGVKS